MSNDEYIIAQWHIYAGGPRGCKYNTTYISSSIKTALAWSKNTGIPIWMGAWRPQYYMNNESAACSFSLAENFTRVMSNSLRNSDIPYDINSDVHFFDIENLTWYPDMLPILRIIFEE